MPGQYVLKHAIEAQTPDIAIASFIYDGSRMVLIPKDMEKIGGSETGHHMTHHSYRAVFSHGLEVTLSRRFFICEEAADWLLTFHNRGCEKTLNISRTRTLDLDIPADAAEKLKWASITGDRCGAESFMPLAKVIRPADPIRICPTGGRPSNGSFPFFDVYGEKEGLIIGIGWSGQWAYEIERAGKSCRISAGLQDADFYLEPGESARVARILVMPWVGRREDAHNQFRTLMREHFSPKTRLGDGFRLPAALQDWCRYVFFSKDHPDWETEQGQIRGAELAASLEHLDTFWMDAMWFEGAFPDGVGNYRFQPGFPRGLKPVADAVHQNGLKFLVWFETERAAIGTDVYENCDPAWLIELQGHDEAWEDSIGKVGPQKLFNLGNPDARAWLTAKIISFIDENGIDIYRQDMNMDPLEFWRAADEENRSGLTEIRFVEGHYRFWDDLLARFPGMLIDNCASGGRRIDLETCLRSVTLWRSDTGSAPRTAEMPKDLWNQNQSLSLSPYLPYHSVNNWSIVPYEFRSAMTMGVVAEFDVLSDSFDKSRAKALLSEFLRLRDFWLCDYYALTPQSLEKNQWAAYQLDDRQKDGGAAVLFRREESPCSRTVFALRGINPGKQYRLVFTDENMAVTETTARGQELADGYEFCISGRKESLVVEYDAC